MPIPYDFVPFKDAPQTILEKPTSLTSIAPGLYSGSFTCQLLAFSPLFVGGLGETSGTRYFFHYPNKKAPCIPAASLKGCIRHVAEALCNGCVSVFMGKYGNLNGEVFLPKEVRPCSDYNHLCPTCRLFGMSSTEENETLSFRGKVSFSDARIIENYEMIPLQINQLYSPRPHNEIYFIDNGRQKTALGRKFYFHHDGLRAQTSPNGKIQISALKPGARFEFNVEFKNLTPFEINLLVLSLELNPRLSLDAQRHPIFQSDPSKLRKGVFHKLGYGKPVGLGTVAIMITNFIPYNPAERYSAETTSLPSMSMTAKELNNWVSERKSEGLYLNGNPSLPVNVSKLLNILSLPNQLGEIRYPVYQRH
ncbi:MAG: RAMP superfamily CRISPR-associated protein [Bacteroidales bacterium]